MQVQSVHKQARISPRKARHFLKEIQGLPLTSALEYADNVPQKAARLAGRVLRTARADALSLHDTPEESLIVRIAVADEGPTLRRFKPRARGSAAPIRKRTSHIRIVLCDEAEFDVD